MINRYTMWSELESYISELEENLTFSLLKHELGKHKANEEQKEGSNDSYVCSRQQKEILNRLIFWTLCSELKEGHILLDIFMNGKLTVQTNSLSKNHILRKLYEGNLCPDDDLEESEQYKSVATELKKMEEEFLSSLNTCMKDKFDMITTNYMNLQSISSTDCFIHGFQFAAKMLIGIYSEYNNE